MDNEKVGCKLVYGKLTFTCSLYKTRDENLVGAWNTLVDFLSGNGCVVPNTKEIFLRYGGKVTYYNSY